MDCAAHSRKLAMPFGYKPARSGCRCDPHPPDDIPDEEDDDDEEPTILQRFQSLFDSVSAPSKRLANEKTLRHDLLRLMEAEIVASHALTSAITKAGIEYPRLETIRQLRQLHHSLNRVILRLASGKFHSVPDNFTSSLTSSLVRANNNVNNLEIYLNSKE